MTPKGRFGIIGIILLILWAPAAVGIGYGAANFIYSPQISQLQQEISLAASRISGLNSKVDSLQQSLSGAEVENAVIKSQLSESQGKVTALDYELSSQKSQYDQLKAEDAAVKSQLSESQGKVTALDSQLSSQKSQYDQLKVDFAHQETGYKEQVSTLRSQSVSLQSQVAKMQNVTVTQHYEWNYGGTRWTLELPLPLPSYLDYHNRPRPRLNYWTAMATDPGDDQLINAMIAKFNEWATAKRYTELDKVNLLIAFVQSLPYTSDNVTTGYDEYPRYPLETVFDRGGDCEDTSILVAALLNAMKYDVALLAMRDAQHMGVGIAMPGASGYYYDYAGKKYYYLETTGSGWRIGQMPPALLSRGAGAAVFPLPM